MADPRGFLTIRRAEPRRLPVVERVAHWGEFYHPLADDALRAQGARCMDCGVPFCQGDTGCPVRNVIPDWTDLVHRDRWRDALDALHATNNFPEFTGRLCPAPCETACVLGLVDEPVAIRGIEQAIADRGFAEGWVRPRPPARETGRRVAVIGSGPAGLAAAQELRRLGHAVAVYEKADRAGGLLRYGIPDFKMERAVLDRRLAQLEAEGVRFALGVEVGVDVDAAALRRDHDAVLVATGAEAARELPIPGRELPGVHLAMEYLVQQNRRLAGDAIPAGAEISARGRRVAVIGGGDTGSDCIGTCHRQGAVAVHQLTHGPQPPDWRAASTPWPLWPLQLRSSHAHEEGCERAWSVAVTGLSGDADGVRRLHAVRLAPDEATGAPAPVAGSEFTLDVELVLLAIGFAGPPRDGLLAALGLARDDAGRVRADGGLATSVDGVYAAGDAVRGASLLVWAIRDGRDAAHAIDARLRREAAATG